MSRFQRKPIPANIPDLPEVYIRKWSIPELFEIQEILKHGTGSLDSLSIPQIQRIVALSLSDAQGARLIADGAEVEANELGADIIGILRLATAHNGMSEQAKNA